MADAPNRVEPAAPVRPSATRIARSAALVIGLLALAKLISLISAKVTLDRFGITSAWDTFTAAHQVPDQMFNLLAGGALSFAFIPIFGDFLAHGDRQGAWRLASNVLNTIFLTVFVLAVIAFITAPWLVAHVIVPGWVNPIVDLSRPTSGSIILAAYHPDLIMQTATLMRILLLSLLLFSISGLVILQTFQNFLLPALAPIMYDGGNIIGALVLARFFGVYGMAIGGVIGAALHLGIQVPGLIRVRAQWQPRVDWRDPSLRQVIVLMIPRAIGLFLGNAQLLIALYLGSKLVTGSVAAYNRGWSLMQLPETLIGTAMGIVIFPTLAMLSASGDVRGKRAAMSGALRFILIAAIPSAVAMFLAGRPLVSVLEGGAFDAASADRVFRVLQFFALGIVVHSAVEIAARSFYADKDTITPLWISLITVAINLGLALIFVNIFDVAGFALANSLAVSVELLILIAVLRRRWQGIDEAALLITTGKALSASAVMGAAILLSGSILNSMLHTASSGRFTALIVTGVQLAFGGAVYLGVALLLRMNEVRELPRLILQRRAAIVAEAPGD